jgi:hypothetical protein
MNRNITDVLTEKKGIAEALGAMVIGMTLILAVGGVIAGYAVHSQQAGQSIALKQEIANRAESYAADLNANLTGTTLPSTARQCSVAPAYCTTILGETTADDGKTQVLRIQGDTVDSFGKTLTQDVTLLSSEVTHVTAVDADGNNVWALSNEGLRYKTWGVASGKPSDVSADELEGPSVDNTWVTVDTRAGIDSKGSLWVWGKNDHGQAGTGEVTADSVKPKMVSDAATHFRTVITGDDRGYAIDSTGHLWAWGKNTQGQLGLPTSAPAWVTTPTKLPTMRFTTISIGEDNVFGITTQGALVMAGASQYAFPAPVAGDWVTYTPGTTYTAVAGSTNGGVAMIDDQGNLTSTGGAGTFTPSSSVKFSSVSFGKDAGYAISTAGSLYSWGQGAGLAQGSTTSKYTPTETSFAGVTGATPRMVAVQGGKTSALAIDTAGQLYYVGQTPSGSVGGTDLPTVTSWTKLLPGTQFRSIADDTDATSAALLDTDGNIYGIGTLTPGLWPMTYNGANNQPIRMPTPAGFSSYTWK